VFNSLFVFCLLILLLLHHACDIIFQAVVPRPTSSSRACAHLSSSLAWFVSGRWWPAVQPETRRMPGTVSRNPKLTRTMFRSSFRYGTTLITRSCNFFSSYAGNRFCTMVLMKCCLSSVHVAWLQINIAKVSAFAPGVVCQWEVIGSVQHKYPIRLIHFAPSIHM